ncbi:hypothetical protein ACF0H5_001184 [Mactra antiquata]
MTCRYLIFDLNIAGPETVGFNNELCNKFKDLHDNPNDVNKTYEYFNKTLCDVADKFAPIKRK